MKMLCLAVCAAATSALMACSPLSVLDAIVPDSGYVKVDDIRYGPLPRQALDLYLPEESRTSMIPAVVFFYGGSWRNGKRSQYRFVGQALASRGIAVAIVDYRIYPDVQFPTFVEDGAKASSLLIGLAPKYGINPNRLFLMGHSAGAHIAALLALDSNYMADAGVSQDLIAGLIGLAGPYAFNPLNYETSRPVFLSSQDDIAKAQPISHASAEAPPALLLHGDADETVIPANTEELSRALEKAGVQTKVRFYPGIGHVRIILSIATPFQGDSPVLRDIVDFIKSPIDRKAAKEANPMTTLECN